MTSENKEYIPNDVETGKLQECDEINETTEKSEKSDIAFNDTKHSELEHTEGKDVTDRLKEVISSEKNSVGFQFLSEVKKSDAPLLSVKLSVSELPQGRERIICNFLKSFIGTGNGMTRKAVITGTQDDYDRLVSLGCENAFASGVDFEITS
ncbi:MAG: hypothetical protein M1429_04490 [Patescibacteria group bacterium]|nr:hypothetical protein [Patescibacteria group bacterium]